MGKLPKIIPSLFLYNNILSFFHSKENIKVFIFNKLPIIMLSFLPIQLYKKNENNSQIKKHIFLQF